MTRDANAAQGGAWTLDRLERLLDRYGADPAAWPASERSGALRLVEADPVARGLMEETARLDVVLAADIAPVAVPDGLRSRILAAAPAPGRQRPGRWFGLIATLWPFEAGWQPAMALAASGAIGFVLGLSGISAESTGVSFDSAVDSLVLGPVVIGESLL